MRVPISKNWFGPEEYEAVQRPLREGWVVQGGNVARLETEFASFAGSEYAIACSSGTAALHIAVMALGIRPGDEVIVPAFTWVSTANVVELQGARPVFCDIDLETFNISPAELSLRVTDRTVGVLPVHLFGMSADMDAVLETANAANLWVVEDAACALGTRYRDRHAGTMGAIGCFSFHPRKSITTGEGGMVVCDDADLARRCDALRNHGLEQPPGGEANAGPRYTMPGFNYRLTDIQGALGCAQFQRIDFLLAERQRCADFYAARLSDIDWLRLPAAGPDTEHSWQSYVTLYAPSEPSITNVERLNEQRNGLMSHLEAHGISTRMGTHAPPHLDYYASKYGIRPEDFPRAYIAERLSLALPAFPGMSDDELEYVARTISSFDPGANR